LSVDRALRTSEIRYRRLFEAAQDGILLLNADTAQIEDANPYVIHMLGYTHPEMLGRKLWEVGAIADAAKSADMFAQLQATGYVRYADMPLKTKAGRLINVEFVSNSYDCDGVRVIQCNIRDITEQRRAEAQAHKLSLVVEQSPQSIAICGLDEVLEYVNEALVRSSGYSRDELLGHDIAMLYAGPAAQAASAELRRALDQGGTWHGELRSRRKDGTAFDASAVVATIHQPGGEASHHVTITEDITQHKKDALELERHRHQLEALVQVRTHELVAAKKAAEAANIAKSAFLANMSHEIRTPLVAVTGMAYLIRRSGVTPQQAGWLTMLETGGQHLLEIINAVLDLSKIDAGKLAVVEAELNVGALIAGVSSMLSERAAAKRLRLLVEVQPLPSLLLGDATRLQQALLNYTGNAIKFTEAGSVTLRASSQEETADTVLVRFEVEDTGIGIAAQTLPRLFGAFEQADNSTTRLYGGTGLGLAIVRQLARLMGGEAGVRSSLGAGSCFWFTARLRKPSHAAAVPVAGLHSAESRLAQGFPAARILLVDDEASSREVTLELLRTVLPQVQAASDGAQAVQLCRQGGLDLVLMDMQMPHMDGLEATRQIRQLPGGTTTLIIGLTANAFADDKARCLAAGMDDFLTKPFQPEQLFETLLRCLAQLPKPR
jgi:PAS domain S-box-containing protein